ncbi:MAG: HEPN domain-containing protein [Gemmatimonadetes bacterium]|nr:HEPN domain-containing protein [Gemmatimonadota bacterium]
MTMADPKALQAAREWFDIAEGDLRSAKLLLEADPPEIRSATFHCQQAAEKYLKGFLVVHGEEPPKIHILEVLLERAEQHDPSLPNLLGDASVLTTFAVEPRYPLGGTSPRLSDARDALARAGRIRDAIQAAIPELSQPAEEAESKQPESTSE